MGGAAWQNPAIAARPGRTTALALVVLAAAVA